MHFCKGCKTSAGMAAASAARAPKREAQARARVAEGFDDEGEDSADTPLDNGSGTPA